MSHYASCIADAEVLVVLYWRHLQTVLGGSKCWQAAVLEYFVLNHGSAHSHVSMKRRVRARAAIRPV